MTLRACPILLALSLAGAPAAAATRAFVFQTDYVTGSLSSADLSPRTPHCDVASPSSDAVLRWYGGRLYVVNRFGADNIQVVDPATWATVKQFSVGPGSNPHDIAFASSTHAYVSRFGSSDLWIVDPTSGAHTATISLAPYADADGLPEMDRMMLVGPLLFVSLERIDEAHGYQPTDTSLVAVIDTRADTLVDCDALRPGVQALRLQLTNPVSAFQFDRAHSQLLIGCAGRYGVADGGIERIDVANLASAGVAIGEAVLGGDVTDFAFVDGQKSYAIVSDAAYNTSLVSWRPDTGALLGTLWSPGGFTLASLAANDLGELWVCENSSSDPRVRVFSIATDLASGSDLVCTLPPVTLTFDSASAQVAAVESASLAPALGPAWPSPARSSVRLSVTQPSPAPLRAEVLDVSGRRIRVLHDGDAGMRTDLSWDLRDGTGGRVRAGVYYVRAHAGAGWSSRPVVVLGE